MAILTAGIGKLTKKRKERIENLKRLLKSKKTTYRKLERWLADFDFTDISTAEHMIDWIKVPEIVIPSPD